MKNIDGEIYKNQLLQNFDWEAIADEFELLDKQELLKETIEEELDILIESNIVEFDDPKLTERQFFMLITQTATRIHLDNLVKEGLIQAEVDPEIGENVYSLTEKGKKVGKKLF